MTIYNYKHLNDYDFLNLLTRRYNCDWKILSCSFPITYKGESATCDRRVL